MSSCLLSTSFAPWLLEGYWASSLPVIWLLSGPTIFNSPELPLAQIFHHLVFQCQLETSEAPNDPSHHWLSTRTVSSGFLLLNIIEVLSFFSITFPAFLIPAPYPLSCWSWKWLLTAPHISILTSLSSVFYFFTKLTCPKITPLLKILQWIPMLSELSPSPLWYLS